MKITDETLKNAIADAIYEVLPKYANGDPLNNEQIELDLYCAKYKDKAIILYNDGFYNYKEEITEALCSLEIHNNYTLVKDSTKELYLQTPRLVIAVDDKSLKEALESNTFKQIEENYDFKQRYLWEIENVYDSIKEKGGMYQSFKKTPKELIERIDKLNKTLENEKEKLGIFIGTKAASSKKWQEERWQVLRDFKKFALENTNKTDKEIYTEFNNINTTIKGISKTYLDIDKDIKDYEKKFSILLPEAKERKIKEILLNIDKIKKQNAHYRTQGTQVGMELYNSKMDKFLQENQKVIDNIEKFKAKYQAQSKANTR